MLHRGAEFWDVGSCDGGLYFDVADHPTAELKLMFAAPDSFCVQHTDCLADIELVASDSAPSPETLCVRPGGNPWRLPRHYFVDRITAWRAVQIFCRDGRCSSDVSWIPFEPSDLQEQTSTENSDFTFFQAEHAVVLPDGTIRIPAGGFGSNGMWDGSVSIAPDSTEYAFWHWVIGQKGRWAANPPETWLTTRNIDQIKLEYAKTLA